MDTRKLTRTIVAGALAAACVSAHAFVTQLDRLTVVRDGATFFDDTFEDGLPPPSALGLNCSTAPNCYSVTGAFPTGSETGG